MKISTIILIILEIASNFVTEDCIKNNDGDDYAIVWHYVSVIIMMFIFVSFI